MDGNVNCDGLPYNTYHVTCVYDSDSVRNMFLGFYMSELGDVPISAGSTGGPLRAKTSTTLAGIPPTPKTASVQSSAMAPKTTRSQTTGGTSPLLPSASNAVLRPLPGHAPPKSACPCLTRGSAPC